MRAGIGRAALVVGAITFGLGLPSPAHAQSTGFAVDRFDPSERGSDWFTLESLDLRGHLRPAIGLVLDYAHRPLAFYDQDGNVVTSLVDNQLFAHVGGSLVLWQRVRLGVNLPIGLYQNGDSGALTGGALSAPTSSFAAGDLRLAADLRIAGVYGGPATLGVGVQAYLPTGSRGSFTGDESVRVAPRIMLAGDVGALAYAARIGIMYRGLDSSFGGTQLGTEMPFAVSAGFRAFEHRLLVGPEVFGTTVLTDKPFAKTSAPLEILLGAHVALGAGVHAGLGGGTGLTRGLGAPAARFVGSIEWAPGVTEATTRPSDRDGDGVLDEEDACPDVPGVRTHDLNTNGCPSDRDEDGIIDTLDACPDVVGIKTDDPKTHGCPDRDGDRIPDAVDACPDVAGIKTSDPKTNGCPADRDGDGVLDAFDACPDVPGLKTSDPKTNGCPDPDRDKDGIVNAEDACPDEPGPRDPDPNRSGCPKAFVVAGQIKILDQVKFKTGSTQILPGKESEEVLQAVLAVLQQHADIKKLKVEGHTDNVGGVALNKKLSEGRAASVVAWLTAHGIDAGRLSSAGYGLERPLDSNATEAGRKNNRRVEFHIEEPAP
jgi:OOP family OmpA-OmpF porin